MNGLYGVAQNRFIAVRIAVRITVKNDGKNCEGKTTTIVVLCVQIKRAESRRVATILVNK